jgi:DNA-binding CsgD family transcriptional regulator/energy-coupling factor transporter ATP-binding protein EcfA2/tetratricopeptide (TPR) repeat protein
MGRAILERERELAELDTAVAAARSGDGSVVLIMGEPGIGKSSLVKAISSVLPSEARLLVGYCDDLATPRVLGPLRDLIGSVGTALTEALVAGDRGRVIDAMRGELDWAGQTTVLVVEDVHWADEATLDVLRYLVRRIAAMPAVLVLTYRDQEVTRDHPLQQLLGVTPSARRLRLTGLSAGAVRQLGAGSGLDTDRVFEVTSGNPLFVNEVLRSGDLGHVPQTIVETVQARLSDLDSASRDAVERLAVIPSAVERWLVEAIVPAGLAGLAAAEERGVLSVSPARIVFRHELMRRAVVDSMSAVRRVTCNESVLAALLDSGRPVDVSRIMHHAVEAGNSDTIVHYGPTAAAEAVAAESHREAVSHYRLVVENRAAFALPDQANLLEGYAIECYTVGLAELAVQVQEDSVSVRRGLSDTLALGIGLRWLSRMYWWAGNRADAEVAAAEAIAVLENAGDAHALAFALSNQSQLYALAGRRAECAAAGNRAVAMARELDDAGLLSHALNNVGLSLWDDRKAGGREMLAESLAVALAAGEAEHACRAYVNTTWYLIDDLELDEATALIDKAIDFADGAEFLGFLRYMHVVKGMLFALRGSWDDAEREARWATTDAQLNMRCPALIVLGQVRTRRGQDSSAVLTEAWEIARKLGEPQRIGPAASAVLEAAWLRGDAAEVASAIEPYYKNVRQFGSVACASQLGYWLNLAGAQVPVDEHDHPYALQASGNWRAAATLWQEAGCEYEYASALAESPDPADVLEALTMLDAIGAGPLARRVRQKLQRLGVTRIPRGPAQSTRDNPAGLTQRQAEVVTLLANGMSNAEIAARLVLSVRTVDAHVAAILVKLDVQTRQEAATKANVLGITVG